MIIKKTAIVIYNKIPSKVNNALGQLNWLKPLRDQLFRGNGSYKEVEALIKRTYQTYTVEFKFLASFQLSAKATKRGVESTLLNNSIILLKKYQSHKDDLAVLDVGANFGFLSLVWANTIAKNGQTIAFEPNIHLFSTLSKSIKLNGLQNRLSIKNNAVGAADRTIEMYMGNTTSNVLTINDAKGVQPIEMITLDTFSIQSALNKCNLLKIDVDGIELEILHGATQLIKQFRPVVIIETNDDRRIVDYMKQLNYTLLDMDLNTLRETDTLPLNVFCVANEAYL